MARGDWVRRRPRPPFRPSLNPCPVPSTKHTCRPGCSLGHAIIEGVLLPSLLLRLSHRCNLTHHIWESAIRRLGRPPATIHLGGGNESNRKAKAALAAMMEIPMMGVNTTLRMVTSRVRPRAKPTKPRFIPPNMRSSAKG